MLGRIFSLCNEMPYGILFGRMKKRVNDGTDFYIQKPEKIKVGLYHRDLCGGGFSSRCSHAAREEGNGTGKPYNAKRGPSGAGD